MFYPANRYYTLATFDVSGDIPGRNLATASEPFNLDMRYNIRGLDIRKTGTALNPYSPVYVEGVYVIMLFRQMGGSISINRGNYDRADSECPPNVL